LVVNPEEATRVKDIFQAYLAEGCVSKLQIYLEKKDIRSKKRLSKAGNASGNNAFSRGALYSMLQNRIYLGEITHKDKSFPGQHPAIIDRSLWDRVQVQFKPIFRLRGDGRAQPASAFSQVCFTTRLGIDLLRLTLRRRADAIDTMSRRL
jgi:site-specific DNA recombinase